jgi:uncharacterized delta-60 repeat protein
MRIWKDFSLCPQLGSCAKIICLLGFCGIAHFCAAQPSLFDSSFAIGGGATKGDYGLGHSVNGVVIQSDNRIVVGGSFEVIAGQPCPNLARLTSDGEFDDSFGSGTDAGILRLLQQPDGKILVTGGFTTLQGVTRYGIGRLLTNGVADADFDAGSFIETNGLGITLGLQPDGKVLVGTIAADYCSGGLFRLHTNGQLDDSFVQTNVFNNYWSFAVFVRTNGSILVGGGFNSVNGFLSAGLALLDSGGRLDTNFTSHLQNPSTVFSIVEQTNGSLLVGGLLKPEGRSDQITLARLTASLEWDTNFNTDRFEFSPPVGSYIRAILLQPDGKIVVGGHFQEVGGYWRRNIVRLDSQGRVDPCFNPGLGLPGQNLEGVYTFARQNGGRILAGGVFDSVDGNNCTNITRLLPQSDCDNMRTYLRFFQDGTFIAAATFPPGGTNTFQISSNLVDWIDYNTSTHPYLYYPLDPFPVSSVSQIFFRGKKQY